MTPAEAPTDKGQSRLRPSRCPPRRAASVLLMTLTMFLIRRR